MKTTVLTLIVILFCFSSVKAESNRCSFGDFNKLSHDKFSIAISINNRDTLGGFQIPFSLENEDIEMTCDSVSFINSRCGNFDFLNAKIDNENKSILVMGVYQTNPAVDKTPLLPGNGLVATAYCTITNINDIGNGNRKKNIRFIKKNFKISDNTLDFSFWTASGETVAGTYEDNVFDVESVE